MIDVNCNGCSNFMFLFATHDLTLTNVIIQNVNNPDLFQNQGETKERSGLVGFLHHPTLSTSAPRIIDGYGSF